MHQFDFYLLFDHVEIHAANAISSPLTYGFPAITGFVGATHALSRELAPQSAQLDGVIVACHNYDLQTYQASYFADQTFIQTRNPLKRNGETASIIEEGKIHLDVSLVMALTINDPELRYALNEPECEQAQAFLHQCKTLLAQQRIAGGSVIDIESVELFIHVDDVKNALVPAFILMDARKELTQITEQLQQGVTENESVIIPPNPTACTLDALLEVASLHHIPDFPDAKYHQWQTFSIKRDYGWLVPMPVGYQAISERFPAGKMQHCRSNEYPSQYVESIYSLGKWVFPYSISKDLSHAFWRYQAPQNNLYLITQGE